MNTAPEITIQRPPEWQTSQVKHWQIVDAMLQTIPEGTELFTLGVVWLSSEPAGPYISMASCKWIKGGFVGGKDAITVPITLDQLPNWFSLETPVICSTDPSKLPFAEIVSFYTEK